jgi:uncharacterized protein YbjT (DUF2867 family)
MRLLVAGATGGLGRLLVAEAIQRDTTSRPRRDPARSNLPDSAGQVRGDVLDPASPGPAVEGGEEYVERLPHMRDHSGQERQAFFGRHDTCWM